MGLSLAHFIVCVHIASKESVYCIQYGDVLFMVNFEN